jgi:hypothetical protein
MRYLAALGIWILFVLAVPVGFVVGLLALPFGRRARNYASRIFRSHNRAAATLLGFDGRSTISSECGRRDCRACRVLCRILAYVLQHPNHCQEEAKE